MLIHTTFIIIHFGNMLCMFMSSRVVNVGINSTQWLRRCGRLSTLVVLRKSWPRLLQGAVLCALYSPPHPTPPNPPPTSCTCLVHKAANTGDDERNTLRLLKYLKPKNDRNQNATSFQHQVWRECFNFHTPTFAKRWCLANWTRPPRWLKFSFSSSASNNLPTDWWNV